MELLPFKSSTDFSIGIELEFQIITPHSLDLATKAKDLVRNARETVFESRVKPELTQSMVEINSSIHLSLRPLLKELNEICTFLNQESAKVNVLLCGGGTHPFQKWISRKIFPTQRYRDLSRRYKYIAKRSTVFGMHMHIGCSSPENAIYLTHILARFVPQFIAISASSPFYAGTDTGYHSARATIFNNYPLCGTMPYVTDWQMFSDYHNKLKNLQVIGSMKDFYWDIRPKPEYGTVEVRVCDTPLTLDKVAMITAYIQSLASYIIREKPLPISQEVYSLHSYNKFQGARFGLQASVVNPYTMQRLSLIEDILSTIEMIAPHSQRLGNTDFINQLKREIGEGKNDAVWLREIYDQTRSLRDVVREQCKLFKAVPVFGAYPTAAEPRGL